MKSKLNIWHYAVLALVTALVIFVRLRLLDMPLDRDEGGWAYAGWLLNGGEPLYSGFYHMKFPLVYIIYAVIIKILGHSAVGIHAGLLITNIATAALIFFIALRLYCSWPAVAAGSVYLLSSLSARVEGFSANTEHFIVLFISASALIALVAAEKKSKVLYFTAGVVAGLAVLCKQSALLYAFFLPLFILWVEWPHGKIKALSSASDSLTGIAVPVALLFAAMALSGHLDRFLYFTFGYSAHYAARLTTAQGIKNFLAAVPAVFTTLAPAALAALAGLFARVKTAGKNERAFTVAFTLSAAAVTCAGLYFRPHYFLLFLPALALLCARALAAGLDAAGGRKWVKTAIAIFASLFALFFIAAERKYLFIDAPDTVCKKVFAENPFVESRVIGKYIGENTVPGDKIAVLGSEPQVLFYAKRKSATGYIYMMDFMEKGQGMLGLQKKAIAEIEAANPEVLVFVNIRISWLMTADSEKFIYDWYAKYRQQYNREGLVELYGPEKTMYYWGKEAKGRKPETGYFIEIMRRKADLRQ